MAQRARYIAPFKRMQLLSSCAILTISGISTVTAEEFLQGTQTSVVSRLGAKDSEDGAIEITEGLIVFEQSVGSSEHEFNFVPENATEFDDDDLKALVKKLPTDLEVLNMTFAETKIRDSGLVALAESLPKGLKNLTLDMFRAEVIDDGWKALAGSLPESLISLHINFKQTNLGDAAIIAFAKGFPSGLKSLTLDLEDTQVGDAGMKALASALPDDLTSLDLDLEDTSINDSQVAALATGLPSGLTSLTINMEDTTVGDVGMKALAGSLPESLISLHIIFKQTNLGDAAIIAFAKGFPSGLKSLTLDLEDTQVGDAGMKAAALDTGLPSGLTSLTINMEDTTAGDVGMKALASAFPKGLLNLDINMEHSMVGDAGLGAIGSALPGNLQSFAMQVHGCDVSDNGIQAFAKGLPDGLQSITLDLHSTKIGDGALEALISSLPQSLRRLDLDFGLTELSDSGGEFFAAKEFPGHLETLYMRVWVTDVGDTWMEAFSKALPDNLKKLVLYLDKTNTGDEGLKALGKRLPDSCAYLELNVGFTRVGDRGLRAVCAPEALHRTGAYLEVLVPGAFVSPTGADNCAPSNGAASEVKYDSSPVPWPKRINDLMHNDKGPGKAFDCMPQDWIVERNDMRQTAWQRASATLGPDSELVRCLAEAGGHPGTLGQILLTISRPKTWLTIAIAVGAAIFLTLLRTIFPRLSVLQPANSHKSAVDKLRASTISAPLWFRNLEVAAHMLMFCGPVMLALDLRISMGVFAVGFVLVAFAEHGWKQVLEEPVFTFASRTPSGFAFSCLRAGILAHIAWTFTAHAGMKCKEETHYSKEAFANLTEYSCAPDFEPIKLFGLYSMTSDAWEGAANKHLAVMSYDGTWQTERYALPLPEMSDVTLEVNLKLIFDTYIYALLIVGMLCPVVVLVWLAWQGVRARRGEDVSHRWKEEKEEKRHPRPDQEKAAEGLCAQAKSLVKAMLKYKEVTLFFVDMLLDANSIFRMLWTENYGFAVILMAVWFASLFEEITLGDIFNLRQELIHLRKTGELTLAFQRILAREASFDSCVSLALTSYAFPYTCGSTYAMITGALSMLSSCFVMGKYLHRTLDLHHDILDSDQQEETEPGEASTLNGGVGGSNAQLLRVK